MMNNFAELAIPRDDNEPTQPPHRIEATLITKLNLADFQNAVPLLRELRLINDGETPIQQLELTISSIPPFLKPKAWRIEAVGAGQCYHIPDLDVRLDGPLLTRLIEAESATVSFTLCRLDETPEELARLERPVELLPRNQWGGLSHLPDMVAAFVQPNEPAVERLLKQAAEILRKSGKSSSLNGYTNGPKRVWELASGLWSAVAALGLDYSLPPASFEHTGQKIRGPAQITESGLATCLDLALLFCAALEQMGLNPLLIFTKGHAFAGVWLKPEEFSTTVVDDVTALRKRVKLKELVLFETTVVAQRPTPLFSQAVDLGARQIAEEDEEAFELAVDIRRARLQRIKPLASAEAPASVMPVEPSAVVELPIEEAPDLPDEGDIAEPDPATLNPKDRLARWQRKLLDLSLRNNLLNFKSGKKSLKLEAPNPGALEDMLSEGQALKLLPRPDLMDGADPRNLEIYQSREHEDLRRAHALDALKRREVFVAVPQDELEARLVDLYRTARNTLHEGGANTLFLALGFLSWTKDANDNKRYRAPLILVPVTLDRKSVRSGFTLTLHDDEPRFNPTLIEMLRQDFKLGLGVADGELPRDEAGLDVAAIWAAVSRAIKDIKGWEVTEDVALAMFSFAKYLMWKDLAERTEQLRENAVVRHLMDTPREPYPSGMAFPNPRRLDREFAPEQTFCPLPADSSQLSAVMAAALGKDFVLIGPPGTGKSQTIANLIAQCLAEGKRVLFVSEKIAALDVVYRRLREVGLGEFCLELHSNKARKLDVLAQLQQSWSARGAIDPATWRTEAARLKKLRDELNTYVERLHFRHPNGFTLFEAIGGVVGGQDVPVLALSWHSPNAHGAAEMEALRAVADRLQVTLQALGQDTLLHSPLAAIEQGDWSPSWQQTLIESARGVIPTAQAVQRASERFIQTIGFPALVLDRRTRSGLVLLARALPYAAGRDWRFLLRDDARLIIERLQAGMVLLNEHRTLNAALSPSWPEAVIQASQRGLQLLRQRREILAQLAQPWASDVVEEVEKGLRLLDELHLTTQQLSVKYDSGVEELNVNLLQRDWTKAEKSFWPRSWFRKRRIRKQLYAVIADEGEPDVGMDIRALVKIRGLRSEISSLETGPETGGVWAGLKTKPHFAQSALAFQRALDAARQEQAWEDIGFEPIAEGRCGERLAAELTKLRTLRELTAHLQALETLGPATAGLWKGLDTQPERLEAALLFISAAQEVRESGTLPGNHPAVAQGMCGAILAADFQRLTQRADLERRLTDYADLRESTAGLWQGLSTRSETIEQAQKLHTAFATAIAHLANTPEQLATVKAPLERLIGEGNALLGTGGTIAESGAAYLNAWNTLQPAIDRLAAAGHFADAAKTDYSETALDELIERCTALASSEHRLNAWCAWRKARDGALVLGLAPLVAGIENGGVNQEGVRRAFEVSYSRWWLNAAVDADPVICGFVSAVHEKRITDFRELDDRFTALTRDYIRAGLCADMPEQDSISRNSEWGILKYEMNKKRQHLPLRQLMSNIPTALTKLTPCLLMSPLSIAQYLAASVTAFDVVVFDEASQIPVWDAIGAIARGKQVVMVGDPKQLPPTSFFDRAESGLDDEDVEGDLESILDECLGANLPTLNLAWHYRSRNESLIAFSNHRYYGGELVTFPSPVTEDQAVSFHPVVGEYQKGGTRTNPPEAKALVADLVARLKSPGFRNSKLTIGVVTFNTEQQALIEDLLDAERRKDPAIEEYFSEAALEPVFVKNLESVQGDERDIMYFSITYGPDSHGAVSMNFGPMNRDGGERRLNVAITRARHELRVFSSLKAEQMDLARTQAKGVRDLKHFLEFAERGPRALAEADSGSRGGFESPFEAAVATALARRNWRLDTQVGVSAFRIDLAVVHPDAPGVYLTGIECDGATYHRSHTARDRDKLREQVLRGLGWEILRVWSTDWWIDPHGTLEKLDGNLRALLEADRARRAEAAVQEAARRAAAEAMASAQTEVADTDAAFSQATQTTDADSQNRDLFADLASSGPYAKNMGSTSTAPMPTFVEADPASVVETIQPDAFYETAYDSTLARMIAHIVEVEGPVRDSVLARRIARVHGWQRTGSRIQERVDALATKAYRTTQEEVGTFYWPNHREPNQKLSFRRALGEWERAVDEICMPELVSLAREILVDDKRGEDAVTAMARVLGMRRPGAASRGRIEQAIEQANLPADGC